ncbi:MAG: hypothetical protein IJJ26_11585, partial [Victivallales bacterium]|nr:hypothetical protein [Victivallales bacterium]
RYLSEFEALLAELPTPVEPDDVFVGRMREARWPYADPISRTQDGLASEGHITLPLAEVLSRGLAGIETDVEKNASRIATPAARTYRDSAHRCITAIRDFARRWSEAARAAGKLRAAEALAVVPYGPAYDLFSSLQSIWMMQFVASCVCGARDFAPGRLDGLLAGHVKASLREVGHKETLRLFAFFLIKFNEITGTATDNYARKPTPCTSSKQYITFGGPLPDGAEAVQTLLVEAAELVRLPQPTLNFRLSAQSPDAFWQLAGHAAQTLGPQCNFFNDDLIHDKLRKSGIAPEDAANYAFTACNRVDLPGKLYNIMRRIDRFDNSTAWFRTALERAAAAGSNSPEAILSELRRIAIDEIRAYSASVTNIYTDKPVFRFESLFLSESIQQCRDIYQGGAERYRWQHHMFSGIATIGDSLAAIQKLVTEEQRFTLPELLDILDQDFAGHAELRDELRTRMPKFGNGDPAADRFAAAAGNTLIDALEEVGRCDNWIMMPSFYSLTQHARFGAEVKATPDGRSAGEPVSENQSPVHGADHESPTALLRSVATLPLRRCICGGLNLNLSGTRPDAEQLTALLRSFFALGGQHVGFTFADRATLEDARLHPEKHRTLFIRKTGFSEFFIALSPEEQQEIIDRTEY